MDLQERFAKIKSYEKIVTEINPNIKHQSGIYAFFRFNEKNELCFYVGQAKDMLQRVASHFLDRKTHFDKSLYVHKFGKKLNKEQKWWVKVVVYCPEDYLDNLEKKAINCYLNLGYVSYNITGGGQTEKAKDVGERNLTKLKNYARGKDLGYEKARMEVADLFDKYLTFSMKKDGKLNQRAFDKFKKFLEGKDDEDKENGTDSIDNS